MIKNKAYDCITNAITAGLHLHPIPTGQIVDHVYAIKTGTVNFFIYKESNICIGIDSGFGKGVILREMDRIGIYPGDITHLFLTHSDFDHANGIPVFENAEIHLSRAEESLVTRQRTRMWGFIHNSGIGRPYHLLDDNDIVPVGSIKVQAIATPGHTTGSMTYLVDGSILFVGDTFKLIDGRVHPKRRYINMDTDQQITSIRKLARLKDIRLACTAHNGYTEEFDQAIQSWREPAGSQKGPPHEH